MKLVDPSRYFYDIIVQIITFLQFKINNLDFLKSLQSRVAA